MPCASPGRWSPRRRRISRGRAKRRPRPRPPRWSRPPSTSKPRQRRPSRPCRANPRDADRRFSALLLAAARSAVLKRIETLTRATPDRHLFPRMPAVPACWGWGGARMSRAARVGRAAAPTRRCSLNWSGSAHRRATSWIQALNGTQPSLPMRTGRAGTLTHDYKRHGTTALFSALITLDGQSARLPSTEASRMAQSWRGPLRLSTRARRGASRGRTWRPGAARRRRLVLGRPRAGTGRRERHTPGRSRGPQARPASGLDPDEVLLVESGMSWFWQVRALVRPHDEQRVPERRIEQASFAHRRLRLQHLGEGSAWPAGAGQFGIQR
jgi:hypothetical protein